MTSVSVSPCLRGWSVSVPVDRLPLFFAAAIVCLLAPRAVLALDHVVYKKGEAEIRATGKALIEDGEGGVLLLGRDGSLHAVEKQHAVSHTKDDESFQPFTHDELAAQVLAELPGGFKAHQTKHYVICHNTSDVYAAWCGELFEQILKNFSTFWGHQGFELREPEFPLVAIVFADQESYQDFARKELGDAAASTIGLYSQHTNRMTMHDLTGVASLRGPGGRPASKTAIERLLARPGAERTVATVIHEATHQVAYNTGLQKRFADNPVWVSEGLAMYFETLKLGNRATWGTSRPVNPVRMKDFRAYLSSRPADSLKSLVSIDTRFTDLKQAAPAYGESWALVYYLMRNVETRKQFVAYLKRLAEKEPLAFDEPDARWAEFEDAFGDARELDEKFLKVMRKAK